MTDGIELDSERVGPKRGVVVTWILRKVLGRMDDTTAATQHMVMNSIDKRPAPNHEGGCCRPVCSGEYVPGTVAG